uniref:Uncharacterized protein n=1 Tax=Cucumis melo TaxID=3656 RepID=A0A9I9E7M9_CUCME
MQMLHKLAWIVQLLYFLQKAFEKFSPPTHTRNFSIGLFNYYTLSYNKLFGQELEIIHPKF